MIEFSSPSLRTGLADLPHPALRLMVHLRRGLTGLRMGGCQGIQAMHSKESIGPAMMIDAAAAPSATLTMAENTTHTHTDPAIQRTICHAAAVLNILKPSLQRPVHVQDAH